MSDELQQQLAAFLAAMLEAVKSGGEWAAGQMPLLVQEKILYGRIIETFYAVMGTLFIVGAIVFVPRLVRGAVNNFALADKVSRHEEGKYLSRAIPRAIGAGAWGLCALMYGLIQWSTTVSVAIQVWTAPRLYIIEWLSSLVK